MASVSIYLNFMGTAEQAFNFYKSVFRTEFEGPLMRMSDIPAHPGMPALKEEEKNKVMHVTLPILGGTKIMATDTLESLGHKLIEGNNVTINLEPDSKEETDRLFNTLSEGGSEIAPMRDEFWGYWGCCKDKYGIRWMFNYDKNKQN
ncbi:MAG TPA: VOC family protein [Flavisolibacter sp.]|jgi:PhnB protein|nr:VOC family protein [Flavisolibacter sp.]